MHIIVLLDIHNKLTLSLDIKMAMFRQKMLTRSWRFKKCGITNL